MAEGRGVVLAILGIVALIAVVGLVLVFSGKSTGQVVLPARYGQDKLYGGGKGQPFESDAPGRAGLPYSGGWVAGSPYTTAAGEAYGETKQRKVVVGGKTSLERVPSRYTTCPPGLNRADYTELTGLSDEEFAACIFNRDLNSWCCPAASLQ